MTNEQRVQYVQTQKKKNFYLNSTLSVIGILGFFIIWELLVITGTVDSKKLCDVLEIFRLFIVKFTDPNPDGAAIIAHEIATVLNEKDPKAIKRRQKAAHKMARSNRRR